MVRWIVMDIGCLECGYNSEIVGVFETPQEAERVALRLQETVTGKELGGHDFEVFELPELGIINNSYRDRLEVVLR